MKLIYVCGPYRAENAWLIEQNIRRAEEVALEVWKIGHVAICPHLNTRHFQGMLSDDTWIAGDLEILKRCDGILMLPGWSKSEGSRIEHKTACFLGISIYHTLSDLLKEE